MVNALGAAGRTGQTGNFHPPFGLNEENEPVYGWDAENNAIVPRKMIVLITDDKPGGFGDDYNETVRANAIAYATQARCQGIGINAISVDGGSSQMELMFEYAEIACGWFSPLNQQANHIAQAVLNIFGKPIICSPSPACP